MAMRRIRPVALPTRSRNHLVRALSGWCLSHSQVSSMASVRARGLPALLMPWSTVHVAAPERAGRQTEIAGNLAAIVEASIEYFAAQRYGADLANAVQSDQCRA